MTSPDREIAISTTALTSQEMFFKQKVADRFTRLQLPAPIHRGMLADFQVGDVIEVCYDGVSCGFLVTDKQPRIRQGLESIVHLVWSVKNGAPYLPDSPLFHNSDIAIALRFDDRSLLGLQPVGETVEIEPALIPYQEIYRCLPPSQRIRRDQVQYEAWHQTRLLGLRAATLFSLLSLSVFGFFYLKGMKDQGYALAVEVAMIVSLYGSATWADKMAKKEKEKIARAFLPQYPLFHQLLTTSK